MQLNKENLNKIFNYINDNLDNLNGNGEFDNQTNLINAVERTVEMFKEEENE